MERLFGVTPEQWCGPPDFWFSHIHPDDLERARAANAHANATGEPFSAWGFLRVSLDRGGLGEGEKGEDIDLDGFGMRIWGEAHQR